MIALLQPNELPMSSSFGRPCAAAFVRACAEVPMPNLIRNVQTRVGALALDRWLFPMTIDDGERNNSYVVSPLCAYVDYASRETRLLPSRIAASAIRAMLTCVGGYLQAAQLGRMVQINNWMLSTNLYPDWRGEHLDEVTRAVVSAHPDRAIAFRSMNTFSNPQLLRAFSDIGYLLVPSRQVYMFDCQSSDAPTVAARHNFKVDGKLFGRSGYTVEQLTHSDASVFERSERLYAQLYLEKYPELNPQYTRDWLARGHSGGWLRFLLLRNAGGRIDGVVGFFEKGDTLTAPIVGYDTTIAQRVGLYRMLTWLCLHEAMTRRQILNFSSGAAEFKRLRGGEGHIEYSAVYVDHLPLRRRLAWRIVAEAATRIGVPLMKHYRL